MLHIRDKIIIVSVVIRYKAGRPLKVKGILLFAQLTGIQIQPVEEISVAKDEIVIKEVSAFHLRQ